MSKKEEMIDLLEKQILKNIKHIVEMEGLELMSKDEKTECLTVMYNTFKYLKNYDKNNEILNKHVAEHKFDEER